MKPILYFAGLAVLVFVGVASYRMDALVMAFSMGVFFGVLASVPGSLLILASIKRQDKREPRPEQPQMPFVILGGGYAQEQLPPPPVIDVPVYNRGKREIQESQW